MDPLTGPDKPAPSIETAVREAASDEAAADALRNAFEGVARHGLDLDVIECANSLFGALFAPVAAHRGLGTRSEFTLTDPVLNGLPPPLHAPDALDRLIHLAKHCAVALEASILEYSATAAAVLSTGGGLGARLDQAYGVENAVDIARGIAGITKLVTSFLATAGDHRQPVESCAQIIERAQINLLESFIVPTLLAREDDDHLVLALNLISSAFLSNSYPGSPVTLFAERLVASGFFRTAIETPGAAPVEFSLLCAKRLAGDGVQNLLFKEDVELLYDELTTAPPLRRKHRSLTTSPFHLFHIYLRLLHHDCDPVSEEEARNTVTAVLDMGIEEFCEEAMPHGQEEGQKRAEWECAGWIVFILASFLHPPHTPLPSDLLHPIAHHAKLSETEGFKASPGWQKVVLPWLWKLAVGSLRGAVLLETRYWIAAGAPMDGTLLPRGGVEVIADLITTLQPNDPILSQLPGFFEKFELRPSDALEKIWKGLSDAVCSGAISTDHLGGISGVLQKISVVMGGGLPVPSLFHLAKSRFFTALSGLDAQLSRALPDTPDQALEEISGSLAEFAKHAGFLSLFLNRLTDEELDACLRFVCTKEIEPWRPDAPTDAWKTGERAKRALSRRARDAAACVLAGAIASGTGEGVDRLVELLEVTSSEGMLRATCRMACAVLGTALARTSKMRDDPELGEEDRDREQEKENVVWGTVWGLLCGAFLETSPYPPEYTAFIAPLMSEIILYLRARGCTLFAKHLLSSARFKYLVNHALEQLFPQISLLKRRRELQQRTGLASAHPANPTLSRITPLFLDLLLLSSIRADVGWFEEEVKTWKDGPGELAWLAAEEARQSFDRFGTKGLAWVWTRVPVV